MEFDLLIRDLPIYVSFKFEMLISKRALVIIDYVGFAIFVQTVLDVQNRIFTFPLQILK